jgi:hypothetical protein
MLPVGELAAGAAQADRQNYQGDDDDGPDRDWSASAGLLQPAFGLSPSPSAGHAAPKPTRYGKSQLPVFVGPLK